MFSLIGIHFNIYFFWLISQVPFILVEGDRWPQSDYIIVNMDGSRQPLPLTTAYQRLELANVSPFTFLQAMFGLKCPVSLEVE